MTTTITVERVLTQRVDVAFDRETNILTLSHDGAAVAKFTNEKVDSGALVGVLSPGRVVLPLENDEFPDLVDTLRHAGIVRFIGESWSAYGGRRYRAAEVLID